MAHCIARLHVIKEFSLRLILGMQARNRLLQIGRNSSLID